MHTVQKRLCLLFLLLILLMGTVFKLKSVITISITESLS